MSANGCLLLCVLVVIGRVLSSNLCLPSSSGRIDVRQLVEGDWIITSLISVVHVSVFSFMPMGDLLFRWDLADSLIFNITVFLNVLAQRRLLTLHFSLVTLD
jgi:hypothetical protein